MAAYGALVSVRQILDQIHRHPNPPISLHKEQLESLTANLTFLQEFLEAYNPHRTYTSEADPLERRIAEAAYAAEDVIESYIVDQIHARSTDHDEEISSTEFYQGLEKVIQEMDMIKLEVKEKKMQGIPIIKRQLTTDAASLRSSSAAHKVTITVGLDEVLNEMLDKIARGASVRQIIPIVGMGGLGKTTLARNIYENQLVKEHFDIRAWSTISQVHDARKILGEIIGQVGLDNGGELSEYKLGEQLYKYLIGRRYLIVMDDMWSIKAWDVVRCFFPDNENGSRVVVTTRLSNLASMFNYSDGLDMKFMDEATSWKLFSKTVFGERIFPPELEDVGKEILKGCRGLPLSIAVVGGLLSKSEATQENWKVIEENLSSVVNLEDGGSCLQILYMSYNNLPIHLKPCFLYMGVFYEDEDIPIRDLIPLWIAEGFIKPCDGKCLEELGEEYLEELVGRNLLLVKKRNHYGKLEIFKVHDQLRDLALRESEKDKFLYSLKQSSGYRELSQGMISYQRRITYLSEEKYPSATTLLGSVLVRSLIGKFRKETLSLPSLRLLRVCIVGDESSDDEYFEEIRTRRLNLRFLFLNVEQHSLSRILSSLASFLWNLQTLYLGNRSDECFVLDVWKMPLIRHVISDFNKEQIICLPDPPPLLDGDEVVAFENLHTLRVVRDLKLSEEVLVRIPNIRILHLLYIEDERSEEEEEEEEEDYYCLNNLHRLDKLQELHLGWYRPDSPWVQELILPYSLKKLVLQNTQLPWEDMASKIGCLPLLQVLMLEDDAFIGSEWETEEGQFSSLKFLRIERCGELEQWITEDSSHFPRLEHLVLSSLRKLSEIPSSIGDIPTLRSIKVKYCSGSTVESARRIRQEQEEYDNQLLQIQFK